MRWFYRLRNAQYVASLFSHAEIFNLAYKTKWVKMPNIINTFYGAGLSYPKGSA